MKRLPKKLKISGNKILDDYTITGINDSINEYLAEKYGFCITDYVFEIEIELSDIEGDLSE